MSECVYVLACDAHEPLLPLALQGGLMALAPQLHSTRPQTPHVSEIQQEGRRRAAYVAHMADWCVLTAAKRCVPACVRECMRACVRFRCMRLSSIIVTIAPGTQSIVPRMRRYA